MPFALPILPLVLILGHLVAAHNKGIHIPLGLWLIPSVLLLICLALVTHAIIRWLNYWCYRLYLAWVYR